MISNKILGTSNLFEFTEFQSLNASTLSRLIDEGDPSGYYALVFVASNLVVRINTPPTDLSGNARTKLVIRERILQFAIAD